MDTSELIDIDPRWAHRLSVAQYHRMIDSGIFDGDDRIEMLEGFLVEMPPQEPEHFHPIGYLTRLLNRALGDKYEVRPQAPLTLLRSEPEPDLAVTDATRTWKRHPETAFLIVEVADSWLRKDRDFKSRIYAEAAVDEYWVIDVTHNCVHVMTEPEPGQFRYKTTRTVQRGDILRPVSLPDIEVAVSALFRR